MSTKNAPIISDKSEKLSNSIDLKSLTKPLKKNKELVSFDKEMNALPRESETITAPEVWSYYDEVLLLVDGVYSSDMIQYLPKEIENYEKFVKKNQSQFTPLGVRIFRKNSKEFKFVTGNDQHNFVQNQKDIFKLSKMLKNDSQYYGDSLSRYYILENIYDTLDRNIFSEQEDPKLLRIYLSYGLRTINMDLFDTIEKKAGEQNVHIEFISLESDVKHSFFEDSITHEKRVKIDEKKWKRIFTLQELRSFVEENKDQPGLILDTDEDYDDSDEKEFYRFRDSKYNYQDSELEGLGYTIPF